MIFMLLVLGSWITWEQLLCKTSYDHSTIGCAVQAMGP